MLPDVVLWEMSYKSQSRRLTSCIDRINVLFWKCSGSVGGVGWVPNDRRVASSNTGSNCPHVESYAVPMALSRHHLWRCQLICLQWMPWVTLERCTVSFPRSHFTPSGLSTQRSGTNGGIRWCSSSLVMLESQLHLSFCVRDRIVFVCHRRQINCGVVWRTELRPPIPSPSSVPPASHCSLLTRVCLHLFSYPPLSARLRLSPVPSCSLSPALCSFGAGSLLFRTSCLLHEENSFCCRCDTSQLLSPSRLSHFHNNRMVFYEDWVSSAPSCFPLSLPCPNLLPSDPNPFVLCP